MRYTVAIFLIIFAAIHGGYEKTPQPPGALSWWKGNYGDSWLFKALGLPGGVARVVGALLWAGSMIGFLAAGAALFNFVVPTDWWEPLTIAAAAGSLLLALLFWHPYQWISALVDGVILVALLATDLGSKVV